MYACMFTRISTINKYNYDVIVFVFTDLCYFNLSKETILAFIIKQLWKVRT